MKEIPELPSSESQDRRIEKERTAIRIEDWARENDHETLLSHIASSEQTNRNIGVLRENIYYDPEEKTITLTVTPQNDMHQGHSIEGTGIMLGGIPKVFVDVTSGALAFTAMSPKSIPLHTKGSYENSGMIILSAVPLVIQSSFKKDPESDDKNLIIVTTVTQGGEVCVKTEDTVRILSERVASAIVKRRVNDLHA